MFKPSPPATAEVFGIGYAGIALPLASFAPPFQVLRTAGFTPLPFGQVPLARQVWSIAAICAGCRVTRSCCEGLTPGAAVTGTAVLEREQLASLALSQK